MEEEGSWMMLAMSSGVFWDLGICAKQDEIKSRQVDIVWPRLVWRWMGSGSGVGVCGVDVVVEEEAQ